MFDLIESALGRASAQTVALVKSSLLGHASAAVRVVPVTCDMGWNDVDQAWECMDSAKKGQKRHHHHHKANKNKVTKSS